jgi:hypothetical protein
VEAKNAAALASAHDDVKDFVWKITLLEGELVAEHRAGEVSMREGCEQFEELTLLQIRGSELCHAIISPIGGRHHLSEGMWPSTILKWPRSLPHFGWWCLLLRSRCLGGCLMTPFAWRLWVSWLPNSKSWRSATDGLSGLL